MVHACWNHVTQLKNENSDEFPKSSERLFHRINVSVLLLHLYALYATAES